MCRSKIGKAPFATLALALTAILVSGCAIGFRGPAPDVSDKTAFVQGDVLSNRTESGEAWFKYGTTSAYGQETPHGTVEFEAGVGQGYFGLLSGLDHHTTYHFALCADDQEPGVGAFCSGDQAFTTVGDHIRGTLQVLVGSQVTLINFNDVESGYNGEDPRGTITQTSVVGAAPVVCMRLAGQKFTVATEQLGGASYAIIYADLSPGANWATGELVTTRPAPCPPDPAPTADKFPAAPGVGFEIEDAG
jgi:hypothetical protein